MKGNNDGSGSTCQLKTDGGHLSFLIGKDMSYFHQILYDIKEVINKGWNQDKIDEE